MAFKDNATPKELVEWKQTLMPNYNLLQRVARAIADSQCNDVTMGEKYPNGMPKPYLRLAEAAIEASGIKQMRKLLKEIYDWSAASGLQVLPSDMESRIKEILK